MSLRERRAAERKQIGTSTCFLHPESRLKMKNGDAWCDDCGSKPVTKARVVSETEKYLTGDPTQNAAIRSKLKIKHGDMTVTSDNALVLRDPTNEEVERAGRKFNALVKGFGDANISQADIELAAQLNNAGFLPQHFNVIHGNLYLNFLGASFWTKRTMGASDGGSSHRPMTAEECEFYQLEEGEVGVVATYHKIVGGTRFEVATDIGRAGGARDNGKNPIAMANRPEMAIKRALVRVMRQAAPLGVEIGISDDVVGVIHDVEDQPQPAIEAHEDVAPKIVVTPELAAEAVEKISELGIGKEDVEKFNYLNIHGQKAVIAMLSDDYTPDQVAGAVAETLAPPVPAETTTTTNPDGPQEDIEELPW